MRKQRSFNNEFKCQVVLEALSGAYTPAQICKKYNIQSSQLGIWISLYKDGRLSGHIGQEETALKEQLRNRDELLGKAHVKISMLEQALMNSLNETMTNGYHKPIAGAFTDHEKEEEGE
jgi:transposase-like protein